MFIATTSSLLSLTLLVTSTSAAFYNSKSVQHATGSTFKKVVNSSDVSIFILSFLHVLMTNHTLYSHRNYQ